MADISGLFCWLGVLLQSMAQLAGLSPAGQTVTQVLKCLPGGGVEPSGDREAGPSQPAVVRHTHAQWLRKNGVDTAACAVQLDWPGARPAHHTACDLLLADDRGQLYGPHHAVRVIDPDRAFLHLPSACPKGLAVAAAAAPRLLEQSADDAQARSSLCGLRTGVLRRKPLARP